MTNKIIAPRLDHAWSDAIIHILDKGIEVSPRGKLTKEVIQNTVQVDMRKPVLVNTGRKLSYPFMAAEAAWILSGSDLVSDIAPWNKHISAFSDDGERFFGAYGPKIMGQIQYVVEKLQQDKDSRQAGLVIWRENPPETKDVPCTVAIFASIRDGNKVNMSVYMRSSDVWLGLPYDAFNFSMLAHLICCYLNNGLANPDNGALFFEPGMLSLTAASMHIYEPNWVQAIQCAMHGEIPSQIQTPEYLFTGTPISLIDNLKELRDTKPGDMRRWWEK